MEDFDLSNADLGASREAESSLSYAQLSASDQTSPHSFDTPNVDGPQNKGADRYHSIYSIAMQYGYAIRKYKYATDDGYINTVFRLLKKSAAAERGR